MGLAYVIGLGKSGMAAARLLQYHQHQVIVCDRSSNSTLIQQQNILESEGITVKLNYTPDLMEEVPNLIVVSPGVPWDIPLLVAARAKGIDTIGEMGLAWRDLKSSGWVGITGTNGKTTTTAIVSAIFQANGNNYPGCGNIGYAAADLALTALTNNDLPSWVIAEISSYQIESSAEIAPNIGVWTTFTPDHLARHKTLENYYQIKAHLLNHSEYQILNGDDLYLQQNAIASYPKAIWTSIKGKEYLLGNLGNGIYLEDDWVIFQDEKIVQASTLRMKGDHNQQNLLMSVAVAKLANIESEVIREAIANFPGVPHRLEYITSYQGIEFINDSKATNYDAAEVGLKASNNRVILIAGGEPKQGDDRAWLQQIKEKAVRVLLIGQAAEIFAQRLQQVGYDNYIILSTLDQAVPKSLELAQKYQANCVLFSPACASFDQYQNFEQRGDHFRELCLGLVN